MKLKLIKMMKNYDQSIEIIHNKNWPYIPGHPNRIFIIGGSGLGKTKVLLNLIKHWRTDMQTIYLYVKGPFGWKYQLLINGREKVNIVNLKNSKAFIDYSQTIDVYENLEDYVESNKYLSPKGTELFLRGRKLNISPLTKKNFSK